MNENHASLVIGVSDWKWDGGVVFPRREAEWGHDFLAQTHAHEAALCEHGT